MKTVIVTPQIPIAYQTGGIGTFVWYFAKLLQTGHSDLHIIFTQPPQQPEKEWKPLFEKLGIPITAIHSSNKLIHVPQGYSWHGRVSELAADAIPADADIVYFADWEGNGFHFVRQRRFGRDKLPVVVTVLHGSTRWNRQGMGIWPSSREELAQDFRESYVAEQSDFVVSPSHYMLDWAQQNRWVLPPKERVRVLSYPFTPPLTAQAAPEKLAAAFERLVFFGRLDMRKGIDLFVDALLALKDEPCLQSVKEIVLLGGGGDNIYGSPEEILRLLQEAFPDIAIEVRTNLSSFEAQAYLAEHKHNTLVVLPSRSENTAFTSIESSLLPGLNLICSNAGGIPEVLGPQGQDQLFAPYLKPLIKKLEEWLLAGPRDASHMGRYDWENANQRWLAFHQEVCEYARTVRLEQTRQSVRSASAPSIPADKKSVDVCIPYYNLGAYLPYLLESLAKQTSQDFNVFVVNDGSTEPNSVTVFEEMSRKYRKKPWKFLSTENQGVSGARNLAASLGNAECLCFLDADNIAAPNMVERFIEAFHQSGCDCLTCYLYSFEGEAGYRTSSGLLQPAVFHYVPLGNCPALGILDNPFGDGNCMMRRSAFEAVGGFTRDVSDFINHEDRELLTRLSLAGYHLDVIPEFLLYYRHRPNSRLRTTDHFLNDGRVLRHYEQHLAQADLGDLAPLALGLYYRSEEIAARMRSLVDEKDHLQPDGPGVSGVRTRASVDLSFLVYQVSGYSLVQALRVKIRNQVARRFGRPLIPKL